ncbi:hypothetical protein Hs20B_08040 [Lactococcus insecticola]|uniref:SGNH hydrolase-type esterase domain-containing protein n=2 Tax=Pseudolactococcus insecticola TaxID=2709158 RepID=A0A6A0B620_9LACT|nr:hypothetical protein Hs20B_08040 [Lactococcus insecticola]
MAYYPINETTNFGEEKGEHKSLFEHRGNEINAQYSQKVAVLAEKHGYTFINANAGLTDETGNLKADLTFDGAHMLPDGYEIVLDNLLPYL